MPAARGVPGDDLGARGAQRIVHRAAAHFVGAFEHGHEAGNLVFSTWMPPSARRSTVIARASRSTLAIFAT